MALGALTACAAPSSDDGAESAANDLSTYEATTSLRDARLVVRTNGTAFVSACEANAACADVDGDGLVDAWEDAVLDRLRPRMALHPDEPLLSDPDGRFGYVARVFRPKNGPANVVRVIIVTGFSFDPGVLVLGRYRVSAHDGDSERVAVELTLKDGGREATMTRAYFAVHEHTANDQSRHYEERELADALTFGQDANRQPRWVVFPSYGKHPEFARPDVCNQTSLRGTGLFRERCAESEAKSHPVLPPVANAGEPDRHRIDDLAVVGFPGDEAWVEQKFCGGFRARPRLGGCAESIAEKLVDDPFAAGAR